MKYLLDTPTEEYQNLVQDFLTMTALGIDGHDDALIAEAHGGRVTVSSEPGKGSAFTLAVPAAPREVPTHTHAEAESLNLAG